MSTDPIEREDMQMTEFEAHASAMSLPINAVVSRLIVLLGATTVATIGGVTETRAVTQWTDGRLPQRPHVLRFTLQLAMMIGGEARIETVRAWFAGSNPHLRDQIPMLMLRDQHLSDISSAMMAAARAFGAQ